MFILSPSVGCKMKLLPIGKRGKIAMKMIYKALPLLLLLCIGSSSPADTDQSSSSAGAVSDTHEAVDQGSNKGKKSRLKLNTGTSQNFFNLGSQEQYLAWESWHHTVTKELKKSINHAVGRRLGEVTVHIVVDKDRKLQADVVSSSNAVVADACLQAIRSLDGDPSLQFPTETQRDQVSFTLNFKKVLFALPRDSYIRDDFERVTRD
jgi:hypothetical protein